MTKAKTGIPYLSIGIYDRTGSLAILPLSRIPSMRILWKHRIRSGLFAIFPRSVCPIGIATSRQAAALAVETILDSGEANELAAILNEIHATELKLEEKTYA